MKTNFDYWKKLSQILPKSYKDWFKEEEKYLQKNIEEDANVLDVGCGGGRSLGYILVKTKKLFGVDIGPMAILSAKKKFMENPFSSIYLGDGRNLLYKDNSFDYVICMITPANFGEEKDKFYAEMKRVVKGSGEIILSVFNEYAMNERMKVYNLLAKNKIKKIKGGEVFFKGGSDNLLISEQFNRKELEEIFERNRLEVIEIKKKGIGYFCRLKKSKGGELIK